MIYKVYGRGLRDDFKIGESKLNEMDGMVYVSADMTSVTTNGDLLFLVEQAGSVVKDGKKDYKLVLCLASCEWRSVLEVNENGDSVYADNDPDSFSEEEEEVAEKGEDGV